MNKMILLNISSYTVLQIYSNIFSNFPSFYAVELGTAEKELLRDMAQQTMNNNSYGYVKVRYN